MATRGVVIDDAAIPEFEDAFAWAYPWSETLEDGTPNPLTKAQHMRKCLAKFCRDVRNAYRVNRKTEAAALAETTAIKNEGEKVQ